MAERARPTIRCLREDLALPVPRADTLLDEIAHPLLAKATERFADEETPQERISAIDDQVLFKVKVQRWRGAVWVDADLPRLVAAGQREEGSPEDFYTALAARGSAARARYNAEHSPPLSSTTYSEYLLPGHEDDLRWQAEAAARAELQLRTTVHDLVRQSLLDGHEHAVMLDGAALGIQVLADRGHEAYVAIRIIGIGAKTARRKHPQPHTRLPARRMDVRLRHAGTSGGSWRTDLVEHHGPRGRREVPRRTAVSLVTHW